MLDTDTTQQSPVTPVSIDDLEGRLSGARPRLVRLARARGLNNTLADEAAQEALVEAWRHLDRLRLPDRFDAWLDGICRNVCRRAIDALGVQSARQAPLPDPLLEDANEGAGPDDLPDTTAPDLTEILFRDDLHRLVDRALGALPASAREALTLCYLEESPQREAALQLGLTISALEARLHRARQALRHILSSDLREDALALDIPLDDQEEISGWRETSLWCNLCGKRKLVGIFEPGPNGEPVMRMRCPDCSRELDGDITSSGFVPLGGLRSFRPTYKRMLAYKQDYYMRWQTTGTSHCPLCGGPMTIHVEEQPPIEIFRGRIALVEECPRCYVFLSWAATACLCDPTAIQFTEAHPRWIMEPDAIVSFQGMPAIQFTLADVTSRARLRLFAHRKTLHVLGTILE